MIVGVTPLYDDEKDSYWMVPGYLKMLETANAFPIVLPLTTNTRELDCLINLCDGFLLTGGHDVSPTLYTAPGNSKKSVCCPERDKMDMYILRKCVECDKPLLGICRGIQLMNVCFGGSLYRDLPTEYISSIEHHMKPPYNRVAHSVSILRDTPLHSVMRTGKIGVNSYHHQAVLELSPRLKAAAVSEDGLIEAAYMPDKKFIVGVQWHPEYSYEDDIYSQRLIDAFVSSL